MAEAIYQSEQASLREKSGIEKMLYAVGIEPEEKLVRYIMKLNVKIGEYHTLDMLSDTEQFMKKCSAQSSSVKSKSVKEDIKKSMQKENRTALEKP